MTLSVSERTLFGLRRCVVVTGASSVDELPPAYRGLVSPEVLEAFVRFPDSMRALARESERIRARHNVDLAAPFLRLADGAQASIELHFVDDRAAPRAWLRVVPFGATADTSPAFSLSPVKAPARLPEFLRDVYAWLGEVHFGGAGRGGLRSPSRHGDVLGDRLCDFCDGDLLAFHHRRLAFYSHAIGREVPARSPEHTVRAMLDTLAEGSLPSIRSLVSDEALALDVELLQACARGDVAAVERLLAEGADANTTLRWEGGSHAAMFASPPLMNIDRSSRGLEVGRVLLAQGANARSVDVGWGGTHPQLAIHRAIERGYKTYARSRRSSGLHDGAERAAWRAFAALLAETMGGFDPDPDEVDPAMVELLHDLDATRYRPLLERLADGKKKKVGAKAAELLGRVVSAESPTGA